MPVASITRKSKALIVVPVALLSGAWTVNLMSYATAGAAGAATGHNHKLPDGTSVPTQAIKAPATVNVPGQIAPGVAPGTANAVIAGAASSGIPSVALKAYTQAARIIDSADKTCNIPWELIAAIGRVESDHGQYGGNHLTTQGIAVPGIYGPVLDGKNGTAAIPDTDGGQLDHDTVWDRAVGPMQFIPSTWQVVGVDADNDGKRNPQDINDASLATAVYLCSGNDNLGNRAGQQSAVYRYNHSSAYVNLVLRIMEAYQAGNYTSIPSGSYAGTTFAPQYSPLSTTGHGSGIKGSGHSGSHGQTKGSSSSSSSGSGSATPKGQPTPGAGPSLPGGNGGGGGGSQNPVSTATKAVSKATSALPTPVQSVIKPVVHKLTQAEAQTLCTNKLSTLTIPVLGPSLNTLVGDCTPKVQGKTRDQADAAFPSPLTLSSVLTWLGL